MHLLQQYFAVVPHSDRSNRWRDMQTEVAGVGVGGAVLGVPGTCWEKVFFASLEML